MTLPRKQLICPEATLYYHVTSRCVRRAFLCGEDVYSGKSFEHRKPWLLDKIKALSQVFNIHVCAYAVMSNHYHLVLKIDPDGNAALSDRDVAQRWQALCSLPPQILRWYQHEALEPLALATVQGMLAVWRSRLMDISWLMRCLNESIARKANKEDGCKGRFWEGRFKSQAILDDRALLACMAYVDLNPVRAGICDKLEDADYTSLAARLKALKSGCKVPQRFPLPFASAKTEPHLELPLSLHEYLALVDWTGRHITKPGKQGLDKDSPALLHTLHLPAADWLFSVSTFSRSFDAAAGSWDEIRQFSQQTGHHWCKGKAACQRLTGSG